MQNIWFTSDPHYHHKNIVRGTTEWDMQEALSNGVFTENRVRDFDTLEEHDEALIKAWNSVVKTGDTLYCLGDWSFGGMEQIEKFRLRLNCSTVHLILGNHDQHIEPINSPYRDLFSSCGYYKELELSLDPKWGQINKKKFRICLFHYGMRVWNKSHHGAIHLYGHSHGTLPGFGRSMDVGVDTHDLYPYHLDEILELMLPIKTPVVDHHNKKTN